MATHIKHEEKESYYFITATCYKWLPLIEITKLYDCLPGWIMQLAKRGIEVCGFVAMPNHIHYLVFVNESCVSLNVVLGEAKRFMAYEIVKRLKKLNRKNILRTLRGGVQESERMKGKKHQVFRLSFDAKKLEGENEICRVPDYIHHNPVSGKWSLSEDFVEYPYSSARYYETGVHGHIVIRDYRDISSESSASDSEGEEFTTPLSLVCNEGG